MRLLQPTINLNFSFAPPYKKLSKLLLAASISCGATQVLGSQDTIEGDPHPSQSPFQHQLQRALSSTSLADSPFQRPSQHRCESSTSLTSNPQTIDSPLNDSQHYNPHFFDHSGGSSPSLHSLPSTQIGNQSSLPTSQQTSSANSPNLFGCDMEPVRSASSPASSLAIGPMRRGRSGDIIRMGSKPHSPAPASGKLGSGLNSNRNSGGIQEQFLQQILAGVTDLRTRLSGVEGGLKTIQDKQDKQNEFNIRITEKVKLLADYQELTGDVATLLKEAEQYQGYEPYGTPSSPTTLTAPPSNL